MYLREVQGFRVVAALLVAVYHIWFHRVSGGVDAFFVIAGFFLVLGFLKQERPGLADVLRYWQRTFARIAPSAGVVILATCVLMMASGIDMLWERRIRSAIAALTFTENWWLARNGVDYLSMGQAPSPFQQMWALSVQMQLYLLLPLAVAGALAALRALGWQRHAAPVLAGMVLAAFGYALLKTHQYQPTAYFNTFTRVWEFLAGGLLAFWLPRLVVPRRVAKGLGYLSLAVLAGFAAVIPVERAFPGLAALVPVLVTVGVIIAARSGGEIGLLTNRPMQWLGNLSFTFYLWHWPLYILVWDRTGSPDVGLVAGLAILALAFGLSVLTYELVERPFREAAVLRGRPGPAFAACALALLPAALAAGLWSGSYVMWRNQAESDRLSTLSGAPVAAMVPSTLIVRSDLPVSYADGCYQRDMGAADLVECGYGNPDGRVTAVLVGGSHSLQWLPALQRIAEKAPELRIINLAKSGCAFTLSLDTIAIDAAPEACLEWNRRAIARIRALQPDVVVTIGTRPGADGEIIPEGFRQAWQALGDLPILVLRDNPRASFDIAACVDRLDGAAPDCTLPRSVLRAAPFSPRELPANVTLADFSDAFCDRDACPPVRDGLLVYRDSNHLTATYAALQAPRLSRYLNALDILPTRLTALLP